MFIHPNIKFEGVTQNESVYYVDGSVLEKIIRVV